MSSSDSASIGGGSDDSDFAPETSKAKTTKVAPIFSKKVVSGAAAPAKIIKPKTTGGKAATAKTTKAKPAAKKTTVSSSKFAATSKKKTEESLSTSTFEQDPEHVFQTLDEATQHGKQRLSIEQIYKKLSQLEHVLLRPDTYIGSVQPVTERMGVYSRTDEKLEQREITYVPGLYKIFDEILVNAADNKQRDPTMTFIKVTIDQAKNLISVRNDGKGIPVEYHKTEKIYVPELIFGTLLTSSNYDDSEKKVTGGRNGFGAKLCNIFSTEFTVETCCNGQRFLQTWRDNMNKDKKPDQIEKPIIENKLGKDYTEVRFKPDLRRFGLRELDDDLCDLAARRAYDVAGTAGVKVNLNGKLLPLTNFKDYVEWYTRDVTYGENNERLKFEYEKVNDRWEIALGLSPTGEFQQISFVNSIATTKGGRHVDYICDQLVPKLIEHVKKQMGKKTKVVLQKNQVKNHMWLFIKCLIENPTFDSQTKEHMTLQSKSFGSTCEFSEAFMKRVIKNTKIADNVLAYLQNRQLNQLNQQCSSKMHSKLKGIPKLEDANDAGTKNKAHQCTLILTEGDSAKTLAVAGLGVVGRDKFGVFPLKGKLLNVRDATTKQIIDNAEINNLLKILGLQYKIKYNTEEQLRTLRYGKLMIMADQDQDGSHIKGLVINFIHHNWPQLIQQRFLQIFITPIVKVRKGGQEISFFSEPEYREWQKQTPNWNTWKVKYYKGLGTSTSVEGKSYFSNMPRHRVDLRYSGREDDASLELAFAKKKADDRKEWLTAFMQESKRRRELGLPEVYLYEKETTAVSYDEFVNKELVLFSNMDNERSIPCAIEGWKPGQRKVMFTCFKKNIRKEIKVAQLAGAVGQMSAYHHGEQSLMSTIINLAQDYVGSNNINTLMPVGQFGTRLQGGKDAASPRYIFTKLSPLARRICHPDDDPLLKHLYEDGQRIEPERYYPIIPMVLVNGAEGIGTGWSTKVPNFNPRDIVANLRRMLDGDEPRPMMPWYDGFKGDIVQLETAQKFLVSGIISILSPTKAEVEISELPIGVWTQTYKENVMEVYLNGTDKTPPQITDFKEYHTDTTVRFVATLTPEKLREIGDENLHQFFKLSNVQNLSTMVLFDHARCLKRYNSPLEILQEFFAVRLEKYGERRAFWLGMREAEALKLSNQARFILECIERKICEEKFTTRKMVDELIKRKYDPDPVKMWQRKQKSEEDELAINPDTEDTTNEDEEAIEGTTHSKSSVGGGAPAGDPDLKTDFDYLIDMKMRSKLADVAERLCKQRDAKLEEVKVLKAKTPKQLWIEDLDAFEKEYDAFLEKKREVEATHMQLGKATAGKGGAKKLKLEEVMPSPRGQRVKPNIEFFKAKVEAAEKAKENKGRGRVAKRTSDEMNGVGMSDEHEGNFMDRVMKKKRESTGKPADEKSERGIKKFLRSPVKMAVLDTDSDLDNGAGDGKQIKKTTMAAKKVGVAKKTKKKAWESDSESGENDEALNFDDEDVSASGDSENDFVNDIAPRELPIRNRKPAKYNFDDDYKLSDDEDEAKPDPSELESKDDDYALSDAESEASLQPKRPADTKKSVSAVQSNAMKKDAPAAATRQPISLAHDSNDAGAKVGAGGDTKKIQKSKSKDVGEVLMVSSDDEEDTVVNPTPPKKTEHSAKAVASIAGQKKKVLKKYNVDDDANGLSDHSEVPPSDSDDDFVPHRKKVGANKRKALASDSESSDVGVKNTAKSNNMFDFDELNEGPTLASKATTNANMMKKSVPATTETKKDIFGAIDDDDHEAAEAEKKAAPKKKLAVASTGKKEAGGLAPPKKPASKRSPAKKARKQLDSSDDESDVYKDSDDEKEKIAPSRATGRARKQVNYKLDDSPDEENSD